MKPKIAVVMSLYNETEDQINQSVNSILKQTYTDFEFIIVNDAPGDKKLRIISQKLEKKDPRIKLLYNETNIGLAMSMNKAVNSTTASFIARMDADDIAYPNRLEKEIALLNSGIDLVFSACTCIDNYGNRIVKNFRFLNARQTRKTLPYKNTIIHPTIMIKKSIFQRAGGYRNFPCAQDYDLWLRLIEQPIELHAIEDPLIDYRIRDNGISNTNPAKQDLTAIYIRRMHRERLKNNSKDSFSSKDYNKFLKQRNLKNDNLARIKAQKLKNAFKTSSIFHKILSSFKLASLCIRNKYIRTQEFDDIKFHICRILCR